MKRLRHFDTVLTATPSRPRDPDVLLAIGGGQHDPGPKDLTLLGRWPAQPWPPAPAAGWRSA